MNTSRFEFDWGVAPKKIWRDLLRNKGRTLLVVLSIAVGVMTVGAITATSRQLQTEIARSQAALNPSHVWLNVAPPAPPAIVDSVRDTTGVVAAVGYQRAAIRWRLSQNHLWDDANLIAIPNYTQQEFDLLTLLSGDWPTLNNLAIEAAQVADFDLPPIGGELQLRVNNRDRTLPITGSLRDPYEMPPPFAEIPTFYVSRTTFERLVGTSNYTQIRFVLPNYDEDAAEIAVDAAKTRLERQGYTIPSYSLHDPTRHLVQDVLDGILFVLQVLAILSLALSVFLVVNTINALIAQQIPQIGIMKTVGGLTGQIIRLYLSGVIIYGLLSLLVAIPLGALAAHGLTQWMLSRINIPLTPLTFVPETLLLQVGAGLLTPLLAALWPVVRGAAISVREALSSYGTGLAYGTALIDRLLSQLRQFPRMLTLALRNTFRNLNRVLLTQVTLVVAGAVFLMVQNTHFSFTYTIDRIFDSFGYDVIFGFQQPQRVDKILPLVDAHPNVARAEMWIFRSISGNVPGASGPGSEYTLALRAVPIDTQLFSPELTDGRNLLPNDGRALLLNQKVARTMGLTVGDTITLNLNGKTSDWVIVGLIFDLAGFEQNSLYLHRETVAPLLGLVGRSSVLEVKLINNSLADQLAMEQELREYFESQSVGIGFSQSANQIRQAANAQFGLLSTLLLVMALLIAAVGAIGLSGILSINVLERRREIGVMRAVGASSFDVAFVFISEGLFLGLLSWVLAIPLGYIISGPFIDVLGVIVDFPFVYRFSMAAVWRWLLIVTVLSLAASWLPARRATQISVRESLSYE